MTRVTARRVSARAGGGSVTVLGARHAHPWAVLASGETLTTTCRNYDDGHLRDPRAYAPVWSEM